MVFTFPVHNFKEYHNSGLKFEFDSIYWYLLATQISDNKCISITLLMVYLYLNKFCPSFTNIKGQRAGTIQRTASGQLII